MLSETFNIEEEISENKAKLELYRLIGEGYKAMWEKREIVLEDLEKRWNKVKPDIWKNFCLYRYF